MPFNYTKFHLICGIFLFSVIALSVQPNVTPQLNAQLIDDNGTQIECMDGCPLYQEGVQPNKIVDQIEDENTQEPLNSILIIGLFTAIGGVVMSIPCILVGAVSLSKGNHAPAIILILIGPVIFSLGATVVIILS